MVERRIDVLLEGLAFPECLRWHNDRLWFSDVHDHTVHVVSGPGTSQIVMEVEGQPSGLGWLPDGHLIVVSQIDRQVLRLEGRDIKVHADLRPFFEADMRWLSHYGFRPLDFPTLAGGLSS